MKVKKSQVFNKSAICLALSSALALPVNSYAEEAVKESAADGIERIQVTASRRASTVQEAPLNITALDGDVMKDQNITQLSDVARWVPGLSVADQGGRTGSPIIVRGLNTNSSGPDSDAGTVATYIGEIPLVVDMKLIDVERVEVLIGPQGTLYGAGTLGGAIRYLPNKPILDETSGSLYGDIFTLSESDITEFYEVNKQRYKTEEQVSVDYVVLNKSDLNADIDVDAEQIDQGYQEYLDQIADTEERKASHILIEVNAGRNDDTASALAQQLSVKAISGEDFSELAKKHSDDIGSKNVGGDLGFNTRGGFVNEFDDALFAMTEGQVSEPVKTEFGYHVIKLDAIRKPEVMSKEAKQVEIIAEIKFSQVNEMFAEKSEALAAAAFENDDIENLVETSGLDLKAQKTSLFSRSQGSGIALNAAVRNAAFAEKVLADRELSDVIEISADQVIVIGLSKHVEPAVKPLVDVKLMIESQLLTEKASELAAEKASALVASFKAGEDTANWIEVKAATFADAGEAPAELNKIVFSLAKDAGEVATSKVATGQAVARLKSVSQIDVIVTAEENASIRQAKANESFYVYRQWAKTNSDIERNGS